MVLNSIKYLLKGRFSMIYVGIDVAKDKHDCFITNSDGEVLFKSFTIPTIGKVLKPYFRKYNPYQMI